MACFPALRPPGIPGISTFLALPSEKSASEKLEFVTDFSSMRVAGWPLRKDTVWTGNPSMPDSVTEEVCIPAPIGEFFIASCRPAVNSFIFSKT